MMKRRGSVVTAMTIVAGVTSTGAMVIAAAELTGIRAAAEVVPVAAMAIFARTVAANAIAAAAVAVTSARANCRSLRKACA